MSRYDLFTLGYKSVGNLKIMLIKWQSQRMDRIPSINGINPLKTGERCYPPSRLNPVTAYGYRGLGSSRRFADEDDMSVMMIYSMCLYIQYTCFCECSDGEVPVRPRAGLTREAGWFGSALLNLPRTDIPSALGLCSCCSLQPRDIYLAAGRKAPVRNLDELDAYRSGNIGLM